jgi:dihydrofolate synthase/folylpolyglutamate synthase
MKNYTRLFENLEMFGIKLGLEQTRRLFALTGSPERKLRFIHIAGSNGKGSVGAMLACALSKTGFKTGFYSSPHLISVRERFRINGRAIPEKTLSALTEKITPVIDELKTAGFPPTYFEVTTALAAAYFADENCGFVIWETGMGGSCDATNIVMPELSVITGIAVDHTAYLGKSVAEIAKEKAGIIKQNTPLFTAELPSAAAKVIAAEADIKNAPHTTPESMKNTLFIPENTLPLFQQKNLKTVSLVLRHLSEKYSFPYETAVKNAVKVRWPGRFQILENGTVIDGAHNPEAVLALTESLKEKFPDEKFTVLFAAFADKDIEKNIKYLSRIADSFIFTEFGTTRKSAPAGDIQSVAAQYTGNTIPVRCAGTPEEALRMKFSSRLLVTGSLYLAGAVLQAEGMKKQTLDIY